MVSNRKTEQVASGPTRFYEKEGICAATIITTICIPSGPSAGLHILFRSAGCEQSDKQQDGTHDEPTAFPDRRFGLCVYPSRSMLSRMGQSATGPCPVQVAVRRINACFIACRVRSLSSTSAILALARSRTSAQLVFASTRNARSSLISFRENPTPAHS